MKIQGTNLVLREWREEDRQFFCNGVLEEEIKKNLRPTFPKTEQAAIEHFDKMLSKEVVEDFAIIYKGEPVGGISCIRNKNNNVELCCLWIIKKYRDAGISKDTISTLANHLAKDKTIHSIYTLIYKSNIKCIHLIECISFVRRPMISNHVDADKLYHFVYQIAA